MWKDFKEIWCGMRTAALQTFVRIQNDVYGKSTSKKDSFDPHASSWQLMNVIFLEQNSALKLLLYSKKIASSVLSSHTLLEVSVAKKKNFWYHLSGVVVNLVGVFFTHRQIKNPASSEIAVKTHSRLGPYLADHFACVTPALKKGWIFYLPMGKKWTPVGPQQSQIGGIKSSLFLANWHFQWCV